MVEEIGVGIVGAGYQGSTHAMAYSAIPEARIVAICDVREERAKVLAKEYGADWYSDYQQFLKRRDIDAVSICTPNALHAAQTILAAEAGKHILVEKPMATSLEDCDRMIQACKDAGVKLMVAHSHRFWPANVKAKRLIEEGEIGRIVAAYDSVVGGGFKPPETLSPDERAKWMQDRASGGGAILFNGIHIIDRLRWWVGSDIVTVFAKVGNLVYNSSVDEYGNAFLLFKNDASAVMTVSMATSQSYCVAELIGTKGILEVKTYEQVRLGKPERWEIVHTFDPQTERKRTFVAEVREFVSSILENREPPIPGEEGRANVEVALAILKSSETGKTVELPLSQ